MAARPRLNSASAMIAITIGFIPYKTHCTAGNCRIARTPTRAPESINIAGKMNSAPPNNQRRPPRAQVAQRNHRLGRRRPRNQIHDAEKIQKILLGDPASPLSPLPAASSRFVLPLRRTPAIPASGKTSHLAQISSAHARHNFLVCAIIAHTKILRSIQPALKYHGCSSREDRAMPSPRFRARMAFALPDSSIMNDKLAIHRHRRPPQRREVDALQSPHRLAPLDRHE